MAMTNLKSEPAVVDQKDPGRKLAYLETLTYVERLHRRLLDVIKESASAPAPAPALALFWHHRHNY